MANAKPISVRLDSSLSTPASRWNYHAPAATMMLSCDARTRVATLSNAFGEVREWEDPLEALGWMERVCRDSMWRDERWVGYISYDLGRLFEKLPEKAANDLDWPMFVFTCHSAVDWQRPVQVVGETREEKGGEFRSTFTQEKYERAVARAMEYIAAGDVFQVNLAQRFSIALTREPEAIYETLLKDSPAAYGALLRYGDAALICNSPELFLRVTPEEDGSRKVITRPIKGTRALGKGMEKELLASKKDEAELNMIVDLERNDLGRVCEIGSVKVVQPRTIEKHPTVYHGVATVEGKLRNDVGLVELLRATFPGGSITGAPKIRAMEIIDELEPVRRGPYCGAIGYLCADGYMEFNIAIRTMIASDGMVHIPVGGGIVADSTPRAEYEETLVKAKAMLSALGIGI